MSDVATAAEVAGASKKTLVGARVFTWGKDGGRPTMTLIHFSEGVDAITLGLAAI